MQQFDSKCFIFEDVAFSSMEEKFKSKTLDE